MRFTIATLGCKVNTAESEVLAGELVRAGWVPAEKGEAVDLCIVNSCAVTGKAAMQSRQAIRRIRRSHPRARIVVTGCYAQIDPEAVAGIEGVSFVVGTGGKPGLVDLLPSLREESPGAERAAGDGLPPLEAPRALPSGGRTRPFLKIQDGCDNRCTYCIVPLARGPSRSLPTDAAVAALRALGRAGYREVVLTGIHLGAFGLDLPEPTDLGALMDRIAAERPVERVRLSSIEPNELAPGWVDRVAGNGIFCRHFHLPLQSGDPGILRRMGRPYDPDLFAERVHAIRARIPDAAIGTDVLVGFPGESEAAFANTLEVVDSLPLTYLHVFPFSPRKGTPAFGFPGRVAPEVLKDRCRRVRRLGQEKRAAFLARQVGRELEVLVEHRRDRQTGMLKGVSTNYQTVLIDGGDHLRNRNVRVRAASVFDHRSLLAVPQAAEKPLGPASSPEAAGAGRPPGGGAEP